MNKIEELTQYFQQTFDDKHLSKSERKSLRVHIAEADLDQRKRDILRAKVFDIAKTGVQGGEGVFALEWLEDASRLLELKGDAAGSGSSVYFSPGDDCLNAILAQIAGARKTLDVCVFTISDDRIKDALINRHRRGVKIRVISDNDKRFDAGSDVIALAEAGIEVRIDRTPYHMHHKFAVVDGDTVLTGSYNWTRSAATKNEENLLVTEEDVVIKRFRREFRDLWQKTDPL
ncbi:MAG: phospholipase D-like domain-containing protein [Bacteroidota bacterium]